MTIRSAVVLGVIASLTVIWGWTALGQMTSVCGYIPSENRLTALTLSGDYRYFNDRYLDDQGNASVGHLALEGFAWADGPEWSYSVDGSARLEFTEEAVSLGALVESEGNLRRYLNENAFVFGGADTVGLPSQTGLTVSALAGAGWGRFYNVTPMAKALRIAEILQEQGVLGEAPSEEIVLEISQAVAKERELGTAGVLQEIESLLGAPLEVSAVLALSDVLKADMTRFCGWDVSLALGYEIIDPTGQNDAVLRARANYATALGPGGELLLQARWRAPFPLAGASWLNADLSYTRAISPSADLSAAFHYVRVQDEGGFVEQTHSGDLTLTWALQANLNVIVKAQGSWGTGYEEPEWGLDIGFSYDVF
jgi:hypothetical protein